MDIEKFSDTQLSLTEMVANVTVISKDDIVREMNTNRTNLERSNMAHEREIELFDTRFKELQVLLDKANELGLKTREDIAAELQKEREAQKNITTEEESPEEHKI